MRFTRPLVLVAIAAGLPLGLGAFTFGYAKGFSYLSRDPRACINCHVMNDVYDGWQKSGHRHVAVCIDCHLPHEGLAKWLAKADQGTRHSIAFTFNSFKEPIEMIPRDREIVLDNCTRCHADVVEGIQHASSVREAGFDCLHCHAGAGHGAGG